MTLIVGLALLLLSMVTIRIEWPFLASLPARSIWFRGWVILPSIGLAAFAFAVILAGAGLIGTLLALAVGIIAAEIWIGLSWYHDWVRNRSLRMARRSLSSQPNLKRRLQKSRLGRLLIRLGGQQGDTSPKAQ
jgi:hypothetical protein